MEEGRARDRRLQDRKKQIGSTGDYPAQAAVSAVVGQQGERLLRMARELAAYRRILARTPEMERALGQLELERTDKERKEERTDERELGSGGPGREDDPGRN